MQNSTTEKNNVQQKGIKNVIDTFRIEFNFCILIRKHSSVMNTVAVLDLSNWRGSAPVFCGAPKEEGFGEEALSLKLGGGAWLWTGGLSPH